MALGHWTGVLRSGRVEVKRFQHYCPQLTGSTGAGVSHSGV